MATTSDTFGRLVRGAINAIADFEGKNATIIQEELGDRIEMAHTAFHRFKQGVVPQRPQIIEVLAEAGVQRGYLNHLWLRKFLAAARYYDAPALIERLCSSEPQEPRPHGPYTNLPAPSYSQFVMRPDSYAEVMEGLRHRSPIVVIVSLGGMGKTSLAREAAAHCYRHTAGAAQAANGGLPRFNAVVWISDKDHPGSTSLSSVLDEIARTLGYPGLSRFGPSEKNIEVEQLMRRSHVLLVVDNFETITDLALLHWLIRLPEPSKALVTTREDRREFQRGAWRIELGGLSEDEARQFIDLYANRLKIKHMESDEARHYLIRVTGGNPKAIEMALGYFKHTGQSLEKAINSLRANQGALFTDLFDRCWALPSGLFGVMQARSVSHGRPPRDTEHIPTTSSKPKVSAPRNAILYRLPPKPLPASRRRHVSVAV